MTKSLDQWLEECPDKLGFWSRFIDVKSDVELIVNERIEEGDLTVKVTDEMKEEILDRYMDQDWSDNNNFISYLIDEVVVDNNIKPEYNKIPHRY